MKTYTKPTLSIEKIRTGYGSRACTCSGRTTHQPNK